MPTWLAYDGMSTYDAHSPLDNWRAASCYDEDIWEILVSSVEERDLALAYLRFSRIDKYREASS
jgi:hypothetical protein